MSLTIRSDEPRQLIVAQLKQLKKDLASRYPDAVLPKHNGDVETMLSDLGRTIVDAEDSVDQLEAKIERLRTKKARAAHIAEACRGTLSAAMQAASLERLEDAVFSATLTPGRPKTLITDAAVLPTEYLRIKVEPNLSKIGDALRTGHEVPGAELSNGAPILTIRTAA